MHIVLIPGFMTDDTLWSDMLPALTQAASVQCGDVFQDDTITGMARRVLSQAPPCFALVGFSMGGYVAREMVRLAPGRVQALVLAATSARADTPDQARRKQAAGRRAAETSFRGLSRTAVQSSLHPGRASDTAIVERILAMGQRLGREVFIRQSSLRRDGDLVWLAEIACPTLVIAAAQDALRTLQEAQEMEAGIPGARLLVIEGSGHMLPIEAPAEFTEAILSFLQAGA